MIHTESGDYKLPGTLARAVGNALIRMAPIIPHRIADVFLRNHAFYQTSDGQLAPGQQGLSKNKLDAMSIPESLSGKSVIDIGCSEGFFCMECARRKADHVVGVDAKLSSLFCGQLLSVRERLPVTLRLDIFPEIRINRRFDYVFCLSVLHHLLSTKNIWKILSDTRYSVDREKIGSYLRVLRSLTAENGQCVVEMPYEYDDLSERKETDFERLNESFITAGFSSVRCLGSWEHNPEKMDMKDRIIYIAYG